MKFIHTADTHLGFEITKVPQGHPMGRQRRSDSINENLKTIVRHAMESKADFLIHSGDLFNKYYIPRETLDQLVLPFIKLSKLGIPVFIIPGNHERSEFPFDLFHGATNIFVFEEPKSISLTVDGYTLGVAGFPFIRNESRRTFLKALEMTEYSDLKTDFNILVTHQAFDEAEVGPGRFSFRPNRPDTVSRHTLPIDFEYIAAGHIHRHQILTHPLKHRLSFVYPGSIQRMSFAEMYEEKGFVEGEVLNDRIEIRFLPLPAYHMAIIEIEASRMTSRDFDDAISSHFLRFDENTVLRFNITGGEKKGDYPDIDFQKLREKMPPILECQFAIKTKKRWIMN